VDISAWSALVPLLSAVVGGLIGSLTGLGAQVLNYLLNSNRERDQRRREKFFELVDLVLLHDHWLDRRRLHQVHGEDADMSPAPITRAQIIAAVHFPSLAQDLTFLGVKSAQYTAWMASAWIKRLRGEKDFAQGFDTNYEAYLKQFNEFQKSLAKYAERHVPK
jgi:hypothetical protein